MSLNKSLLQANITALNEGSELLNLLDAEKYTKGYKPAFHSTIGAHFRHVLEHYRCFFGQLASGTFCYDRRERDALLERDIDYANRTIVELIEQLETIDVKTCQATYSIEDEQLDSCIETTVQRELLFLQSHTVHHYAIIGAMARAFGMRPEDEFGVAIATRTHNKNAAGSSPIGGTPPCAQ